MSVEIVRDMLAWSSVINIGILIYWALFLCFAHDWVYKMHTKWFNITREQFDVLHYAGMMFFKVAVFMFNIVPYLALRIVG